MAYKIYVDGIVQGVGFRPFVYNLATSLGLNGYVQNRSSGVVIYLECDRKWLEIFLSDLKNKAPKNSKVMSISVQETEDIGVNCFEIVHSEKDVGITLIPSDIAMCKDCGRELFDPSDRRYLYPFINCTNCGPRYSIIKRIPYDRINTTMSTFIMCNSCKEEYNDQNNRRFHAQPNCCPACGPNVWLGEMKGLDAIRKAAFLIDSGEILAIKGLGGYHLVCDATNEATIIKLRKCKNRYFKPFAVMVEDFESIRGYVDEAFERDFDSIEAPIIIFDLKQKILPDVISPINGRVGFMKAYTPLHRILFYYLNTKFIVATSANKKDEPIVIDEITAEKKLASFTNFFLHHNRPIHNRVDDSVFTILEKKLYPIRVSRGFAPLPMLLPFECNSSVFGSGAGLKNHISLTKGKYVIHSQFIGDLDNTESVDFYVETYKKLVDLYSIEVNVVVTDLHPDYYSSIFGEGVAQEKGAYFYKLQHHKAHFYSIMLESGRLDNTIGVIFDGLGVGEDGSIWGGEIFYMKGDIVRRFHLAYFRQIGGDMAAKEPYRMLLGYLIQLNSKFIYKVAELFNVEHELNLMEKMLKLGINSPYTSSMGRFFEAVGALLAGLKNNEFEGHAAIVLESMVGSGNLKTYNYSINDNIIDISQILEEIVADFFAGLDKSEIALRFHYTISKIILDCCSIIRAEIGLNDVMFSGGVFQNLILISMSKELLENNHFNVYTHRLLPPNDANISVGQAFYGVMKMVNF
ncbi:MAG: carbamoyltransferase HypF [Calditerrivibrio sp.]|nr:carbamoyltransferase HypF [Calditerrivibrio sp.]